jgi:cyclomaltodextrinase
MLADNWVFYQFSTLGFCGAPPENDGIVTPRINKVRQWEHRLTELGIDAVYFCPVFSSDSHGYDTRDYRRLDERLGTNADFAEVCGEIREKGIHVVLDGVFNHVGRGFWAFEDLCEKKWDSPYKDWFYTDFNGDSPYSDGFYYQGWEGHYELVKLNLGNPEVRKYLFDSVDMWIRDFGIDGLRLDVAYMLPPDFAAELRDHCRSIKADFFIVGETLGDNYVQMLQNMDSVTNYQSYKGIWSGLNAMNMFEIAHTFKRQFVEMIPGSHLLNFVDNHDVSRIASVLTDRELLPIAFGILMAMPGIPCIYYGSEWGAEGQKIPGRSDEALRPYFEEPKFNELTMFIKKTIAAHKEYHAFAEGGYREILLTNSQFIFERATADQQIMIAVNAVAEPYHADFDAGCSTALELLSGKVQDFGGGTELPPKSIRYWLKEH